MERLVLHMRYGLKGLCGASLAFVLACSHLRQNQDGPSDPSSPQPSSSIHKNKKVEEAQRPNAFYYFSLGEKDLDENNLNAAIENFKLSIIYDPESAESYFHLAEAYTRKQMFPEAITAIKKSIKMDPEHVNAHLLLGGIYSASRLFDEAVDAYKTAIKLDPFNHEAKFVTAMIFAEQEKWGKAEKLLNKILKDEPEHFFATYYLGKINEIKGDIPTATVFYKRAVELRPGLTPAARALSVLYEKSVNYYGLIKLYDSILKEDPKNPIVIKKIAQTYLVLDQFKKSKEYFKKYIELEKDDVNAHITLGLILLEMKEMSAAHSIFKQILVQYPKSDKVRFYLAMTYEAQNKTKSAVRNFLNVGNESEHYVSAMAHLTFHLKEKETDRMLKILAKAISLRPDIIALFDLKAQVYEEKDELKLSIKELDKALLLNDRDESILYYLGTLQHKIGDSKKALTTMTKLLKINENNFNALNFIAYSYAENSKNLTQAESMAKKALKFRPDDPYILDSLGWIYFKKGHYNKAIVELEKAANLKPEEAIILIHLGEAYLKLNLNIKARVTFRKAFDQSQDQKERTQILKLLGEEEARIPASEIKE